MSRAPLTGREERVCRAGAKVGEWPGLGPAVNWRSGWGWPRTKRGGGQAKMRTAVAALAALVVLGQARADEAGLAFFETNVRPALVKHCYPCHSHEAMKARGGLSLDHRDGLRKGGDSGPAVVPGKPDQSLLIKAVRHEHASLKMPPRAKLPPTVIRDLERWVRDGAVDPRATPSSQATTSWAETLRRRSGWWSLKPVRRPAVPKPADAAWSDHPVDRFLLARLEERGLTSAG